MPEDRSSHDPARDRLSRWFGAHAATLTTLDPDAPLDDLEPLREIIGDARVVALGEGAHFVREFTTARRRAARFLAERCGFTALAFEFGFAEGHAFDQRLRAGDEDVLTGAGGTTFAGLTGDMVSWLQRHNATSGHRLRLLGIDTPQAGGTLRPALEPVQGYLREVDPEAVPWVESALGISDRIAGDSGAAATPRWAALPTATQDALTAALTRLLLRARAREPLYAEHGGRDRYDRMLRNIEAAWHTDYMFGAMEKFFAGEAGPPVDASVRDRYMADSVLWHLDRLEPGARIVLAAHNNHIQKTPVYYDGELGAIVMGNYLSDALGTDYRAIALTHLDDSVPEMYPDDTPGIGFSIADTPTPPPGPGSVEGALADAGLASAITLTGLRAAPRGADGQPLPDRIRSQSAELPMPVPHAYDAVLVTPTATADVVTSF